MAPITVNNNTIDPDKPGAPTLPKDAAHTKFILLKCKHRLSPAELTQAAAQKVEIQRLVEDKTYLCKYEPDNLTVLETNLPFVEKALVYVSDFVISPAVKAVLGEKEDPKALLPFTIVLHQNTTETGADLFKEVQKLSKDAQIIDSSAHQLRARIPRSVLSAVARIDYVETIEETKIIQPTVTKASEVLKAGNGLKPNQVYQGLNEIIAISDQGFDRGDPTDVHPAFITRNVLSPNESRVVGVVDAGAYAVVHPQDVQAGNPTFNALRDTSGHGTHVAGCALGDFDDSPLVKGDPYCMNQMQAPAPKAKLFFQAIAPGENVIPNMDTLFVQPNAIPFKIHSNSWGARSVREDASQETYTMAESFKIDDAMCLDRELLVIWSVGNDGGRWQTLHGQPVYRQAGDLAGAKNALVVGATYNNRHMNPHNTDACVDGTDNTLAGVIVGADVCVDFSSKGPTTDMRIKPDVVAPGVGILSALSRSVKPNNALFTYENGPCANKNFIWMNGSSQAAPLVAGCAAVLREALKKNGNATPSGALVKAILVNGAVDLAGQQYTYLQHDAAHTKAQVPMTSAPNPVQGFGKVDLERSLRCVRPPVANHGGAIDVQNVNVTDETHPPWRRELDVPQDKPILRVTLAYTDRPGNILQDEIYLSVVSKDEHGDEVAIRRPDTPTVLAYEDPNVAPVPVYTISNVQKVTWTPGEPKVVITVSTRTLAGNSLRAFSIAFFFNAT